MFDYIRNVFGVRLFTLGSTEFTIWVVAYLLFLVIGLVILSRLLKRWLIKSVLARRNLDPGVGQAIATIFQYLFVVVGLLVIMSTAGIDLTTLNVLAGAVGIGVGFGLQTIANNFISGLIILFEQPD